MLKKKKKDKQITVLEQMLEKYLPFGIANMYSECFIRRVSLLQRKRAVEREEKKTTGAFPGAKGQLCHMKYS